MTNPSRDTSYLVCVKAPNESEAADIHFHVDNQTSLLEAMHQLELPVRKACRNGACGICRCQLVEGEITYGSRYPHGLWQKDIDAGVILPCIAIASSNLMLTDLPLRLEASKPA